MAGTRRKPATDAPSVAVSFDFNYDTKRMSRFDADEESEFRSFYIPLDVKEQLGLEDGQGITVTITAA